MIECENGKFYTGTTHDIDQRWREHCTGVGSNYTRKYPPRKLAFVKEYQSIFEARDAERKLKKWSQLKKRKLIDGEWD